MSTGAKLEHRAGKGTTRRGTSTRSSGFTLLEVLIALAILAVSLLILVSAQSSAARMTVEADRILVGSMLARHTLARTLLALEKDGFSEQDELEEDGDFEEAFPGTYPEFRWKSTVRKIEVEDLSKVLDTASAAAPGTGDEEGASDLGSAAADPLDNSQLSGVMDIIAKSLSEKVREITVRVEWGEGDSLDDVTLVDYATRP